MTEHDTILDEDGAQGLRDWMVDATDTLVVDTARIGSAAARGGRRRRRVRTGLVAGGAAAVVAVVSLVAGPQILGGGRGTGGTDGYAVPSPPAAARPTVGNVTVRVGSGGVFVVKGGIAPRAIDGSRIELWAARPGEALTRRTAYDLRPGIGVFGRRFELTPGTWVVEVRFVRTGGPAGFGTFRRTLVLPATEENP